MDLKIYEFECVECHTKCNLPPDLSSKSSEVKTFKPIGLHKIKRHYLTSDSRVWLEWDIDREVLKQSKPESGGLYEEIPWKEPPFRTFQANKDQIIRKARTIIIKDDTTGLPEWTIEADSFDETPIIAVIEKIENKIRALCPSCGAKLLEGVFK